MSTEQQSVNAESSASAQHNPAKVDPSITTQIVRKNTSMWAIILTIYMALLTGIGYVAFWEQDFNKPERVVGAYIEILNQYKETVNPNSSLSNEELKILIQELMKRDADNAGDLQELASQSFNIILGALLAFLSASATLIFQHSKKEN